TAYGLPLTAYRSSKRTAVSGERLAIRFPVLVLIVSGGHTELVLMRRHLDYTIIGATRDDAAGEAFDKVAKLLGLGYPGGPAVSRLATHGNSRAINFPRPMIDSSDFDFSFAGLKTAVLYHLRQLPATSYQLQANVCASFEQAVVDVLVAKTIRAAKQYKVRTVLLGGGVAANQALRQQLGTALKNQLPSTFYLLPSTTYTTDNAAMIAAAGAFHARANDFTPWQQIEADPNLSL
ncbi:tRNA (adenosine(37)-N6)-threonylcarbamoyltransferase complex transferase subunit TsaD, partial [Candidatus Uhrbacteria bacterium]|nr:tRNA (adenosine(37)-N6)-threonylcarbamoyltransferase complex transferase subunit TsaD [Candidatus Uhrbacteria bacterium]